METFDDLCSGKIYMETFPTAVILTVIICRILDVMELFPRGGILTGMCVSGFILCNIYQIISELVRNFGRPHDLNDEERAE